MTRLLLDSNNDDTGVHMVTGQSPLYAACRHGNIECAYLILEVRMVFSVIQGQTEKCFICRLYLKLLDENVQM